MPDGNSKPPRAPLDPSHLAKLVELEMMQKRAERARSAARLKGLRGAAFLFLALVVAGGVLGYFFLFSPDRLSALRAGAPASTTLSPTPQPSASPQ